MRILFIILLFLAFSCNTPSSEKKVKIPCEEKKTITKEYIAWDSIKVQAKIIPVCDEEYTLIYRKDGEETEKTERTRFKVRIKIANDSIDYASNFISENKNKFYNREFTELVDFAGGKFNEEDTSILMNHHYLTEGKLVFTIRWKVRYNSGFDYLGSVSRSDIK